MKKLIVLIAITLSLQQVTAQTIKGQLKLHAGQQITLTGFNYYQGYELAKTTADSLGNFKLLYPKDYIGMGVLKTQDNNSLILALTEDKIQFRGTHLKELDSLQFVNSKKNEKFIHFARQNIANQQAYQAWRYLQPLYVNNYLKEYKGVLKQINEEVKRIENVDAQELQNIAKEDYLYWFLPKQLLVNNMPATVRSYTERLSKDIKEFRNINFNNPNFKTSGLFKELLQGHYTLLENMGQSVDSIYIQMNVSTDYLINTLKANDPLLNTVSENLLKYFEGRSLFPAAAHLSNKLLTDKKCVLNDSLMKTMQKYVTLKVGNTAPDVQLNDSKLSDIKKPVLLVFGASWCSHCKTDVLELLKYYDDWKAKKEVEVVYISIDTDKDAYKTSYQNTPWQNYCDFIGWETQAAKDYFVNATPTYILLDKEMKILVHPKSIAQVNAWVNYRM